MSFRLIKLSTTNGLVMADFFRAVQRGESEWRRFWTSGSAAPMILPDSAGSVAHPHLVVGGGKTLVAHLPGGPRQYGPLERQHRQSNRPAINGTAGPAGDRDDHPGLLQQHALPHRWQQSHRRFFHHERALQHDARGNARRLRQQGRRDRVLFSANGTTNAIMWAVYNAGGRSETPTAPCILRAYNATNIAQELLQQRPAPGARCRRRCCQVYRSHDCPMARSMSARNVR